MPAYLPTEHSEQSAFFEWLAYPHTRRIYPASEYFAAVPNASGWGGKVNRYTGKIYNPAQQKKIEEGLKRGYPDVQLLLPKLPFHGLILEFKRGKNKPTPEQVHWLTWLAGNYYCTAVVWSCDLAMAVASWYMSNEPVSPEMTYPLRVFIIKHSIDLPQEIKNVR